MTMSRRSFTGAAAAAAAGLVVSGVALGRRQADQKDAEKGGSPAPAPGNAPVVGRDVMFEWHEVAPGVHVAVGQGGNAMVIVGSKSATLVDTKNIGFAGQLRREAEKLGRPVVRVISTHHHADHTGGNHAFRTAAVPVIAHANAKPRIEAQFERYRGGLASAMQQLPRSMDKPVADTRDDITRWLGESEAWRPDDFGPTEVMEDSVMEVDADGVKVVLRHAGPGHTDNDVFLWLPEKNVVHTGDLVFNGMHPFIDAGAGATTRGWEKSLEALGGLSNADTKVVPGHGPVGGRDVYTAQAAYFQLLRDAIAAVPGITREAAVKLVPKGTEELGNPRFLEGNMGAVWDELRKES